MIYAPRGGAGSENGGAGCRKSAARATSKNCLKGQVLLGVAAFVYNFEPDIYLEVTGFNCGEGIYPRWTAQQAPALQQAKKRGPLRAPTGINPLATDKSPRHRYCVGLGESSEQVFFEGFLRIPRHLRPVPRQVKRHIETQLTFTHRSQ